MPATRFATVTVILSTALTLLLGCESLEDLVSSKNNDDRDVRTSDVCSKQNPTNGDCEPYEAEERTAEDGCGIAINHAGFTGTGFMDYGGNGTWIEWNNIAAPVAGEYTLTFRYANGSSGDRQSALILNGQEKAIVPFAVTGSWKNWRTETTTLLLKQGNNTIRILANTGRGGPNLDHLLVVGKDLIKDECPADPDKTEPGICGCGIPEGSCSGVVNVALGKGTSQSTTGWGGESSRAVDGNTSGNWSDGSITHTSYESAPWWLVELGAAFRVQQVTIYNRQDCCSDRLSDFHVDLLDRDGNVLAREDHPGQAAVKTDIPISSRGVYSVRVGLYGKNPLSLAEVQVFGAPDQGGSQLCSQADEHKTATLSCPAGGKITSIDFASYGLPTGSCDSGFQLGSCHASSSREKVENACLEKVSCTVTASNSVFQDPCPGKFKSLAIVYTCDGGDNDLCPDDPNKTRPGECGCGVPEGTCDNDFTNGLTGEYFDNVDFGEKVLERIDTTVDFNWGGGSPDSRMEKDTFSVRWTGFVEPAFTESYNFYTVSDDGVRLWVDGKLLIDNWTLHSPTEDTGSIALKSGQRHSIKMEFFENGGGAEARLLWSSPSQPKQVIPQERLFTQGDGGEDDGDPADDSIVKVFILAGQSNMVGAGTVSPNQNQLDKNGGMGTLEYLVDDPKQAPTYDHLVTESGEWTERSDVWLVDLDRQGPLTITKETFGPELQFGHVLGDYYPNQVLIIKTSWGGKSLAVDFRPPSSGGEIGPYYTAMVERVRTVLGNLKQYLPSYKGQGYEIAGFGWHQGWNDRISNEFNAEYQTNCVNLINDLRDEFGVSDMPFVLATTGIGGWNETHPRALSLMNAQLAVPTDPRLKSGNVIAVETRDFWRDAAESPADQGYHWNRNAETFFLIGDSMGEAIVDLLPNDTVGTIDKIYFAQNHVLEPDNPLFGLVSNREALVKVQVIAEDAVESPPVSAFLKLNGKSLSLPLEGPSTLPLAFESALGKVDHNYEDSFTALIPPEWVQPGLSVDIRAAEDKREIRNLKIGAPTRVVMNMFDIHYFKYSPGDYDAGWKEELEAKWPVSELELRRAQNVVFEELVIPPRAGVRAARINSKEDYKVQTGLNFDGEQAAALQWVGALMRAAGTSGRISLYYVSIYGAWAGGQAGGFSGVGNGTSEGILNHELGHSLGLGDCYGNDPNYPYRGEMYGIPQPVADNDLHVGPTWAYYGYNQSFIPPTVQPNAVGGTVGTYKRDPMCGGGQGDQEKGYLMRHFSDYSVSKMREYLERTVLVWNPTLKSYAQWNSSAGSYTSTVSNNGVQYPVERDAQVISVMAGVSAVTPEAILVYPPIGPYKTGLIDLFDPRSSADRSRADQVFCPGSGCDVSLRIVQGGKEKIAMLPITWNTSADPLAANSYQTRAVNLPARDGAVTKIELLLTPDAETAGLPQNPTVLDTWN